jgi:hypothetical protein
MKDGMHSKVLVQSCRMLRRSTRLRERIGGAVQSRMEVERGLVGKVEEMVIDELME